jgi:hypothetical protein
MRLAVPDKLRFMMPSIRLTSMQRSICLVPEQMTLREVEILTCLFYQSG